jgi:hypothetical protein
MSFARAPSEGARVRAVSKVQLGGKGLMLNLANDSSS